MQGAKGKEPDSKKASFRTKVQQYWLRTKKKIPYTIIVLFIQIINLLLTMFSNSYSEGIIVNVVILIILIASVTMDIYHYKTKPGLTRKAKSYLKKLSLFFTPFIFLFTGITILLIAFKPEKEFPSKWNHSDNN